MNRGERKAVSSRADVVVYGHESVMAHLTWL